jgi:PPM family protein phosphatase
VLLVCTDGLHAEVDDDTIAEVLRTERDPEAASAALVDAAERAGGRDNVTVVVAGCED